MGWKTTLYITREDALKELRKAIDLLTDEELADTLESAVGDRKGYNFRIVGEYSIKDTYSNYKEGDI